MRDSKNRQPLPGNGQKAIGVTWYENEQQWLETRMTADDPDNFYDSYEEWKRNSERRLAEIRAAGVAVEKVAMDVARFRVWCGEQGLTNCGGARAEFAARGLAARDVPVGGRRGEC